MPRSGKHRVAYTCQLCRMAQKRTLKTAKVFAAARMLAAVLGTLTHLRPREYGLDPMLVMKARVVSEAALEHMDID